MASSPAAGPPPDQRVSGLLEDAHALADEIERHVGDEGELASAVERLGDVSAALADAAAPTDGLGGAEGLEAWRIALRLWNVAVGAANQGAPPTLVLAHVRQNACLLLKAGGVIRSIGTPHQIAGKHVFFLLRTSEVFAQLGRQEVAESCLSRAAESVAVLEEALLAEGAEPCPETVDVLFSFHCHRAETSWQLRQLGLMTQSLARANHLLPRFAPELARAAALKLAQLNAHVGKGLFKSPEHMGECIALFEVAWELLPTGEDASPEALPQRYKKLPAQVSEYLSAANIALGRHDKAIKVLENTLGGAPRRAPSAYLVVVAHVGLGSLPDARDAVLELTELPDCTPEMAFDALRRFVDAEGHISPEPAAECFFRFLSRTWGGGAAPMAAVRAVPGCVAWFLEALATRFEDGVGSAELVMSSEKVKAALDAVESERKSVWVHLWNAACQQFDGRAYKDASRLFAASLEACDGANRGKTLRMQAVCQLGLREYGRAREYLQHSRDFDPGCAMGEFLGLKINIDDPEGAAEGEASGQVERLVASADFEDKYLRVVGVEALGAGDRARGVARAALSRLLDICLDADPDGEAGGAGGGARQAPVVLRNLLQIS